MPRHTPYTEIGIRRLKCFRNGCNNRARYQWQICADGRVFRPICTDCDIELNTLVLCWADVPGWEKKAVAYAERLRATA